MINSLNAIKQPLDFQKLYPFTACCSDIDGLLELNNGVLMLIEVKKDTPTHSINNFTRSAQNSLLRKLVGNREDIIYVYCTHNLNINKEVPIETSDCIVKYVQRCGKSVEFKEDITLLEYVQEQSREYNFDDEYYIVVKYPNGNLRYCIAAPKFKVWYSDNYNKEDNAFTSYTEAKKYIQARFLTSINHKNEYQLYRKNKYGTTLIDIFAYNDKKVV